MTTVTRPTFTPGPWEVVGANCVTMPANDLGRRDVYLEGGDPNQDIHDARLIAAAPELYEALDHNMQTIHRAHHGEFQTWDECHKETCQRAVAALAKADGR